MGQSPSKNADYTVLLKTLLRSSGVKVKEENFQKSFQAIHKHCHWLDPEKGTWHLNEWKEVTQELFQAIHKHCHWLDPEKGTWCLNGWKEVMPCLSRASVWGTHSYKCVVFLQFYLYYFGSFTI